MAGRFRSRARTLREAEIISVAEDYLVESGCINFSMDVVAARVGIAKGTLYLHFESRAALIDRVLSEAGARCSTLLAHLINSAMLTAAIGDYAKAALTHGYGRPSATGNRHLAYPCCLYQVQCPYFDADSLTGLIAAALERDRADGQLSGDWWDSATMARWIRALLGSLLHMSAVESKEIEREIDMVVRLFHEAIGATREDRA